MYALTDARFDSVRKMSFNDLHVYRSTSEEARKLVDDFEAALTAHNKSELVKFYKSIERDATAGS